MDDSEILSLDVLESQHWWYLNRKILLSKWVSRMELGSQILDLGSASGANTLLMRELGYQVESIELSDIGIAIQQSKGLSPVKADARDIPFPALTFDHVVCLDVIEHITEDSLVMSEIYRVTKCGGSVLLSVPEDPSMWSDHDVAVSHVRRYTSNQFSELVQQSGFSIKAIYSTNYLMKPYIRVVRKKKQGSSLVRASRFENFAMAIVGKLENALMFLKLPGMTIWVEAYKNE